MERTEDIWIEDASEHPDLRDQLAGMGARAYLDCLQHYYNTLVNPEYFTKENQKFDAYVKFWKKRLLNPTNARCYFAFQGQDLAGFMTLSRSERPEFVHCLEIKALYTLPGYTRHGIGPKFLQKAFHHTGNGIGSETFQALIVGTLDANQSAQNFYRRNGAQQLKANQPCILPSKSSPGETLTETIFKWPKDDIRNHNLAI